MNEFKIAANNQFGENGTLDWLAMTIRIVEFHNKPFIQIYCGSEIGGVVSVLQDYETLGVALYVLVKIMTSLGMNVRIIEVTERVFRHPEWRIL